MQARVKPSYRWTSVVAFSGREFVKSEYREVPIEFENQAHIHPALEVLEAKSASAPVAKKVLVEAVIESNPAETTESTPEVVESFQRQSRRNKREE